MVDGWETRITIMMLAPWIAYVNSETPLALDSAAQGGILFRFAIVLNNPLQSAIWENY